MYASARRRLAAVSIALAATTAVAVAPLVAADTASADPTPSSVVAGPATFQPTVLGSGAPEAANSLRGQYRWMGYASQPVSWPAPDLYYRDQTYWGRLERTKGVYDFSYIENGLKAAAAAKGKFGFRVVSYCPGCWMEMREDQASFPPVTPTYLPIQPGTGTIHGPYKRLISTAPTGTTRRSVPVGGPVGRAEQALRQRPATGVRRPRRYGRYASGGSTGRPCTSPTPTASG